MSLFQEEEFLHLTKLCRIHCSPEEQRRIEQRLSQVLSYAKQLDEIDTESVTPCYQVTANQQCVARQDQEGPLLSREKFLANAPAQIGGMIQVPNVMKSST